MVILLHGDDLHPMFGAVVVERRMDGLLRQNGTVHLDGRQTIKRLGDGTCLLYTSDAADEL